MLANNSVTATAKLTDQADNSVPIVEVNLVIKYPNITEVEFNEMSDNYLELSEVTSNEVSYSMIPHLTGVYTFIWTVKGNNSTSTKSVTLMVN